MAPVLFFFPYKKIYLADRRFLKSFLRAAFKKEKKQLKSLHYIFCSDDFLLQINQSYLKHNYYTDIITFELGSAGKIEGEIYISIDRVKENAITGGVTFKEELHRVIFHGALHLCGYKDKLKAEKTNMRSKEDRLLHLYFNP